MESSSKALLLYDRPEPFGELEALLGRQGVHTKRVTNCAGAALHLWSERPPHLLFTDVQLPDGSWRDVLVLARKATAPVSVIVVSPVVDVTFYAEALERGAYDMMVPPFDPAELAHVVRTATQDVRRRTTLRAHGTFEECAEESRP